MDCTLLKMTFFYFVLHKSYNYPRLAMVTPSIIKRTPTSLYMFILSPNKKAENKRTRTKPRLVNGQAKLISSFDIVAIQKSPERNVATSPEKTTGSKMIIKRSRNLSHNPSGKCISQKREDIRHLIMSCEYTDSMIVAVKKT